MLNNKGSRELCYLVEIDSVDPIEGADRVECATVGGWRVMVTKGLFSPGDTAVYFEIDSHLDTSDPRFAFLENKHGNIKTQKYTFGGRGNFLSQGLLMSPESIGLKRSTLALLGISDSDGAIYLDEKLNRYSIGSFLTEYCGVTYADPADNARKSSKPALTVQVPKKLRFLMKYKPLRKIILFLAKHTKHRSSPAWPQWVAKTDEERVQNIPFILKRDCQFVATEKIDGSSATYTMIRRFPFRRQFFVCSRNVCFSKDANNHYTEIAERFHIRKFLSDFLDANPSCKWVTLQGEIFGPGIQKRTYSLSNTDFRAFNLITSRDGRWSSLSARYQVESSSRIKWVPILETVERLPESVDEVLSMADGASVIDGLPREGIVFRSSDGKLSFKAVSNSYLLKYHS